jgi:hypothetical protein
MEELTVIPCTWLFHLPAVMALALTLRCAMAAFDSSATISIPETLMLDKRWVGHRGMEHGVPWDQKMVTKSP